MRSGPKRTETAPPIYDNSLYRRWVIRPLAEKIAPVLYHLGFSGNGVCYLKLTAGMAGAVMLSGKPVWLGLIGMFLLQINFLLDAVDGEVARLRGEAGRLSGEYLDKLCDHLPKTAMYFCWGYGTFHLTGSQIPLICGFALSAWNIIPRFCGVETLLERLDKAPEVYDNQEFHQALKKSFAIRPERGRVDYLLTLFVHPAVNALTLFFLLEAIFPVWNTSGFNLSSRYLFILLYSLISLANLVRKGIRYFKILNF